MKLTKLKKKEALDYRDLERMGPVEKYEKYGKFPLKLVVALFLVIFTACQAVLIVAETNNYSRSQERFLYNMFMDKSDKRSVDYNRMCYLYSVDDLKEHVNKSISNFYNLKRKSLEIVKYLSSDPFVKMEFSYIDNTLTKNAIRSENNMRTDRNVTLLIEPEPDISSINNFNNNLTHNADESNNIPSIPLVHRNLISKRFEYVVNNRTLGPFDYSNDDIREFLNNVVEFRMNYTLQTYVPYYYSNNYDCNIWSVTQSYNFASRGHFTVRLHIIRYACSDYTDGHSYGDLFINKLLWIHVVVLLLAIVSLIQTWSYITWIASMFMKVKSKHKQKLKGEDDEAYLTRSEDSIYYNPLLDENLRKQMEEENEKAKLAEMSNVSSFTQSFMPGNATKVNNNTGNSINNVKNVKDHSHHSHHHRDERPQYKFKPKNNKEEKESNRHSPTFNKWYIISLVGNIIQIFGAAISIFDTNNILPYTEVLVGFGCMLAFFNIGRYIEYSENYSTIYTTIKNAIPRVSRYLLGVTPIFLGFIFFGLCLFWRSERFTSTSNVMIILFALANGDSVYDTFKDLSGVYFFIGQIYLYLFCIIFIVVVLNIFIAIIEDVYITSKMQSKTHWVFDYIQKDKKQTLQFKPPIEEMAQAKSAPKSHLKAAIKPNKGFNDKTFMKKVSFSKDAAYSYQNHSLGLDNEFKTFRSIEDDEERISQCKTRIEEEFSLIEEEINSIMQLSTDIKGSGDEQMIDEMRILVLERINSSVLLKTQDLRSVISKWN